MASARDLQVLDEIWERLTQLVGYSPTPKLSVLLEASEATPQAMTLYVATTGDDGNPGSEAQPLKTIQAAINKIPQQVRHPVSINIGAGNFEGFYLNDFDINYLDQATAGFIMLTGTMQDVVPATGTATGTVSSAVQGAFATNTYVVVNDASQNWTVNDLVGKMFVATGGQGSGQMYPIVANTATQVTLCVCVATTIFNATTTYAIQEPGTNINTVISVPGSAPTGNPSVTAGIYMANNRTKGDRSVLLVRQVKVSPPSVRGVSIADNTAVAFQNCVFSATGTTSNFASSGNAEIGRVTIQGCVFTTTGTSVHLSLGSQTGVAVGAGTILQTMFVGGVVGISAQGQYIISNCYFSALNTGIRSTGHLWLWQGGSGLQFHSCTIGLQGAQNQAGLGALMLQLNNPPLFNNCTTAIALHGPASTIFANSGTGMIGSGNTTAISLSGGARLQYSASATLTGATELSLDGSTASNIANMRAASPKLLTNTYGTLIYE